ncbi:ABC transporter A family member 7 isoform X4 [Physcomitrium patens]|uniref:ABC transporter A family member 7 isoform X4 n=1 Tax=Physcomitrium patens TaxID=3218 RepID=UPI003CCD3123
MTNTCALDPESSTATKRQKNFPESSTISVGPLYYTSYRTQADALFRKNLTYQKRNWKTNSCMVCFPLTLCVLLVVIQVVVNYLLGSDFQCGCKCVPNTGRPGCTKHCGVEYSNQDQVEFCEVSFPQGWPAILQVPRPEYRAVRNAGSPELQDATCRNDGNCECTILYTGSNKTLADTMASYLLSDGLLNSSDPLYSLASVVTGTDAHPWDTLLLESAFVKQTPIQLLQNTCYVPAFNLSIPNAAGVSVNKEFECVPTTALYLGSAISINDELYRGFRKGNPAMQINEFPVAYDFGGTSASRFDVKIWFNGTYSNKTSHDPPNLIRVSRSLNMASQAFLRFLMGPAAQIPLLFVKEMPKPSMQLRLDFSSLLGPHFYMWVLGFLYPVVLTALVYEKQYHLRMMMKMHGLGDLSYWTITYIYFLVLFMIYMFCFIMFGSAVGLNFFLKNDYGIQFVFAFLYVNMIIAFGFLSSNFFWDVKTATVAGYLYVFGSGLLGGFFFQNFVVDQQTSRGLVLALEIIPAFATYRGLFEFSQYSFSAVYANTDGMGWDNLTDSKNGLSDVVIILFMEWFIFMLLTVYLDQVAVSESGINKHPLFFLSYFFKRKMEGSAPFCEESKAMAHINPEDDELPGDRPDVAREKKLVQELRSRPDKLYSIICDNLKRVYPSTDGNPPKYAVRTFSLAVARGECVGMLGPNGAGKTSSINMMIGFLKPTAGTAYIQGMNILTEMDSIYSCMGVCPQHDLLWGQLTAHEHLLFYGRLKNLKGAELNSAVERSLKSVNLFDNKIGDKQCRKYSGGMKRRLSVAISLIGNPQVVYMDEPSTGLDPASRYNLWSVIRESKQDRAIILTTSTQIWRPVRANDHNTGERRSRSNWLGQEIIEGY